MWQVSGTSFGNCGQILVHKLSVLQCLVLQYIPGVSGFGAFLGAISM